MANNCKLFIQRNPNDISKTYHTERGHAIIAPSKKAGVGTAMVRVISLCMPKTINVLSFNLLDTILGIACTIIKGTLEGTKHT
jgi:hypothetical protein